MVSSCRILLAFDGPHRAPSQRDGGAFSVDIGIKLPVQLRQSQLSVVRARRPESAGTLGDNGFWPLPSASESSREDSGLQPSSFRPLVAIRPHRRRRIFGSNVVVHVGNCVLASRPEEESATTTLDKGLQRWRRRNGIPPHCQTLSLWLLLAYVTRGLSDSVVELTSRFDGHRRPMSGKPKVQFRSDALAKEIGDARLWIQSA